MLGVLESMMDKACDILDEAELGMVMERRIFAAWHHLQDRLKSSPEEARRVVLVAAKELGIALPPVKDVEE